MYDPVLVYITMSSTSSVLFPLLTMQPGNSSLHVLELTFWASQTRQLFWQASRSLGLTVTTSPAKMAERPPHGRQVAQAQENQRVTAVPSCSTLHVGRGRICPHADGPRSTTDTRQPLWMGCHMEEQGSDNFIPRWCAASGVSSARHRWISLRDAKWTGLFPSNNLLLPA